MSGNIFGFKDGDKVWIIKPDRLTYEWDYVAGEIKTVRRGDVVLTNGERYSFGGDAWGDKGDGWHRGKHIVKCSAQSDKDARDYFVKIYLRKLRKQVHDLAAFAPANKLEAAVAALEGGE